MKQWVFGLAFCCFILAGHHRVRGGGGAPDFGIGGHAPCRIAGGGRSPACARTCRTADPGARAR